MWLTGRLLSYIGKAADLTASVSVVKNRYGISFPDPRFQSDFIAMNTPSLPRFSITLTRTAVLLLPLLAVGACANMSGQTQRGVTRNYGFNEAQTVYNAKVSNKDLIDDIFSPFDQAVENVNRDINQ